MEYTEALIYANRVANLLTIESPGTSDSLWASLVCQALLLREDKAGQRANELVAQLREVYRRVCSENGLTPKDRLPEPRDWLVSGSRCG